MSRRRQTVGKLTAPKSRKIWARTDTWQPITREEALALRKATKNKSAAACFDSGDEFRRWHELLLLQRAGKISGLERQQVIPISAYGQHMWNVEPDFIYWENGKRVYDDTKGRKDGFEYRIFSLKWKLARAQFPNVEWRVNGVNVELRELV